MVILVVSLDALQMESAPESDTNHQVRSSRALGWTDVDGWRAGGVGGVSGVAAAKPAEREGERRGVLHTSSCRLKREDEGAKGGRAGRTNSG